MILSGGDLLQLDHRRICKPEVLRDLQLIGISTDSRTVRAGELFFAIRGDKRDGHTFVNDAFQRGALGAVVDERSDAAKNTDRPLVVVMDTTKALGQLAGIYRKKFTIPIIAVGGSNGKTTTKEMIAAVLSTTYSVLSTRGNLNNHIGVPQTIFRLEPDHEIAVIELGTNHPGEISYLGEIVKPTHGIVTNVGREHLEYFHDLAGVAKAEGELFSALASVNGLGFVNVDDQRVVLEAARLRRTTTYGFVQPCDVRGVLLRMDEQACATFMVEPEHKRAFEVRLSAPGRHAMANALAAAAIGLAFDVSEENIQAALGEFRGFSNRMEVSTVGGVTIINDTYNANPESVISSLETLQQMRCSGKKIVVLADMLELGNVSRSEHERVGEVIDKMGFDYVLTYGELAKVISDRTKARMAIHYDQKNVLSEYVAELVSEGDCVLVKGSRGMKMEDVVTFLMERLRVSSEYNSRNV